MNEFVAQNRRTGAKSMLTMPPAGWTPKAHAQSCGFSVAKYGPQQAVDPYNNDCGNGIQPNGELITANDPTDISMAIDETFVKEWIAYLTGKYGTRNRAASLFTAWMTSPCAEIIRTATCIPLLFDKYAIATKSTKVSPNLLWILCFLCSGQRDDGITLSRKDAKFSSFFATWRLCVSLFLFHHHLDHYNFVLFVAIPSWSTTWWNYRCDIRTALIFYLHRDYRKR
ncbi:MAG: glycoside hydrolase family 44 protein [Caldilineaceae bacterium]